MVVCKDDGNSTATVVSTKADECGVETVMRFLSTYEDVEIKTDGEPALLKLLGECKLGETGQRFWQRQVLEDIKKSGTSTGTGTGKQCHMRVYFAEILSQSGCVGAVAVATAVAPASVVWYGHQVALPTSFCAKLV